MLMASQLLLRIIALAPAAFGILGAAKEIIPGWAFFILSLCLYIFLVMPFRFYAGKRFRYFIADDPNGFEGKITYGRWLKKGLIRLGRGLPWGIPFFAVLGYLIIGSAVLPYNTMWQPVMNLAPIFGMEATLLNGIISGIPIVILFILLFCFGWLLDMPVEYGIRWKYAAAKREMGRLLGNFAVNTLLFLPALAAFCMIGVPYVMGQLDFSGSVLKTIRSFNVLMETPVPPAILISLGAVFLFLYLPLCTLRKMRNAALTDKMAEEYHAA